MIGFDDIELSTYVGLTTVRQPLFDSGYLGGRLLLEALAQPPTEPVDATAHRLAARARGAHDHRTGAAGARRRPRRGRAVAEIVLEDVWKVYPDGTEAVRALDLAIADKEFIVLVGPVGLRQDHGAADGRRASRRSRRGTVRIGDRVVNDVPPKERDIAMVFQNYALYPHMSVFDNMAFGLKLQKVPKAEIDAAGARGGAASSASTSCSSRKPAALSGGQRQRVAMGRAIVRHPQAFLMDEPLSNLDAKLRVQMRSEIARIQHDLGVTTIYVTHDQTEAMTMGDRVAVIRKGELQQVDTPQALYEHPVNLFVAGFIGSPAMNLFDATLVGPTAPGWPSSSAASACRSPPRSLAARPALRALRRPDRRRSASGPRTWRTPRSWPTRRRAPHLVDRRAARGARVRRRRALHASTRRRP